MKYKNIQMSGSAKAKAGPLKANKSDQLDETNQGRERDDTKEHYSGIKKRCNYGYSRQQDSKEISWMTLLV